MMELLNTTFDLSVTAIILISSGWFFWFWTLFLVLILFMWTPAKAFLVAKIRKVPLVKVNFRDGLSDFVVSKREVGSSLTIKGLGAFDMVEGSQTRDKVSGIAIYECFSENATSFPIEYGVVVQELREKGFEIRHFDDYKLLIEMAADVVKRDEVLAQVKNEEERAKYKAKIESLEGIKLGVKPMKSYSLHELANMFPFDMNPAYVEEYSTAQLTAFAKRHKLSKELFLYAGVGVLVLVIAAFIAYRFLQGDSQPLEVTVQLTGDMLKNGTAAGISV